MPLDADGPLAPGPPRTRPRVWPVQLAACLLLLAGRAACPLVGAQTPPPVVVVETSKGTFAFEMFPDEAPKTVRHVIELVRRGFYDGQRIHRTLPGILVQWGDPQSRDPSKEALWGRGPAASSGTPVGVAEIPKKRVHTRGAVGMAHPGNPADADSQLYVVLGSREELNGRYAIIGRVIAGLEVPDRLVRGDLVRRMYVKE
jgi:cyclophilin family peptidyl-prolyl cis-trans isomerase